MKRVSYVLIFLVAMTTMLFAQDYKKNPMYWYYYATNEGEWVGGYAENLVRNSCTLPNLTRIQNYGESVEKVSVADCVKCVISDFTKWCEKQIVSEGLAKVVIGGNTYKHFCNGFRNYLVKQCKRLPDLAKK